MKYQLIYADPPWNWKAYSAKGEDRSAKNHYQVQDLGWIKSLPVCLLGEERSVLLMWVTDPFLQHGLSVMESWGYEYKTVAFHWAKQCKKSDRWWMGNGYYTRANVEICLLGVKYRVTKNGIRSGKGLPRQSKAVRRLIVSRLQEHSRKPVEAYEGIEQLFGDVNRIELFARNTREGWDSWGNEVGDESLWDVVHR
jgi:N6-adenosine-specific RNA methylase IME4